MPVKWKATNYPGVRYYEHEDRKHGVRKDKYFAIRYQREGVRREEGLGWSSEGWNEKKAAIELSKLKQAHITGEGPNSLKEKRAIEKARQEATIAEKEKQAIDALTFGDFFKDTYYPQAEADKTAHSYNREDALFRHWIAPVIGSTPLKEISPFHIEKIKKKMADKKQSPRSIQYALAVVRQVFNHAYRVGLYDKESPTKKVKKPSVDNKRYRFLSHDEAERILTALKAKSEQVYEIALVSLHCGLRAGEVFGLQWGDVDLERGHILVKDTKSGKNRTAFMTDRVRFLLSDKEKGSPTDLVFPDRNGEIITKISRTFERTVNDLELNKGIDDPRQRVVFHTLRHTYASWLVENGTDLYTVKELMGHSTLAMTERYSHLGQNTLQNAVQKLDQRIHQDKGKHDASNMGGK